MKICGLQKTTLLDFPGKVAATLFTGGCNFRCPFCHNSGLLSGDAEELYTPGEILRFLEKRKNILEGVCITGGEPTLQPDLEDFIRDIRSLGLAVKLDTNGYRPDILKALCRKGLLDYVAMDIKGGRNRYGAAAGIRDLSMDRIDESVRFLLEETVPYEFPGLPPVFPPGIYRQRRHPCSPNLCRLFRQGDDGICRAGAALCRQCLPAGN